MTTPTTPAADDIMTRAAKSVEAAARRSADAKPWEELVQRLAAALNCLPSSFVDGNEHLFKAIAASTARESALVAERDALRAALVADAEYAKAVIGHEEYCERAHAEGWDNDPTGSSHLASSSYRLNAMRANVEEMKAAALALAAPAVEG